MSNPTNDLPPRIEVDPSKYYDDLTGLKNRAWLSRHLPSIIIQNEEVDRRYFMSLAVGHSNFGVLMLDLDRLKELNDSRGMSTGDKYLQETARILDEVTRHEEERPQPDLIRLAGDEFIVILYGLKDEENLQKIQERVQAALETGEIGASIGAVMHHTGENADEFIEKADVAMKVAKRERKLAPLTPERKEAAREIGRIAAMNQLILRDLPMILRALDEEDSSD